jgi:hypothetical protein
VLRNGLAVAGVTLLEDFIRKRTSEIVKAISDAGLPLSALPADLREAVTQNTVRNLAYQVRGLQRDGIDPMPLIESTSRALATAPRASARLSSIALHWAESNVKSDHIAWILKTLGVDKPWDQITQIANQAGFAMGPMAAVFDGVMSVRHAAAHRFDQEILVLDVRSYPRIALAFAIGFDALASRAAVLAADQNAPYLAGSRITAAAIVLRYLDDTGNGYDEHTATGSSIAVHARIAGARAAAIGRAPRAGEVIVQRDRNLIPVWWQSSDLA